MVNLNCYKKVLFDKAQDLSLCRNCLLVFELFLLIVSKNIYIYIGFLLIAVLHIFTEIKTTSLDYEKYTQTIIFNKKIDKLLGTKP